MSIAPPILPTEIDKASYREGRNDAIEECARALEQEAGDQELIHLQFALQTIRTLKDKP